MPRLLVTADLHHDVPRSAASAELLAAEMDRREGDAVLLVGDAATADGDNLERALSPFKNDGRPRLFVPGNHELWTKREPRDARELLADELPRRVREAGWHWLPGEPFRLGDAAVVGSLGWYDHGFAADFLGLPPRFYDAGLSPRAARMLGRGDLRPDADDVPVASRDFAARWNDKRYARGITDDRAFSGELLRQFAADLVRVGRARAVVAAVHTCPMRGLLPAVPPGPVPAKSLKFAFARAFLGGAAFGAAALARSNVRAVVCGHSHVRRSVRVEGVRCENVGSGYVEKRFVELDI